MHTLNKILSDLFVLSTKTKNFHWNVKGSRFIMLHELFQGQYESLDGFIDEVAEQIVIKGGRPASTLASFLKHSDLKENEDILDENSMLNDLLSDHKHMVGALEGFIEKSGTDPGTEDLLTEVLRFHQKTCWILESHLKS
ncbi:MAG: Dps family protein [Candidatus Woesearchaeota archaeon]